MLLSFPYSSCSMGSVTHAPLPGRSGHQNVTMTMKHSYEVSNVNQEPGRTDMSAGVMTPHKKNLICLNALLNGQGRLLVFLFSVVTKDQQVFAVTNSIEFKMTSTHSVPGENMGSMSQESSTVPVHALHVNRERERERREVEQEAPHPCSTRSHDISCISLHFAAVTSTKAGTSTLKPFNYGGVDCSHA